MNDERKLIGRPTDKQLAEFTSYGEAPSEGIQAYMRSELPEGWVKDRVCAKGELLETYANKTLADRLTEKYGADNWAIMEHDEQTLDIIIAIDPETHETAAATQAKEDLGHVALEATDASEREG